MVKATGILWDTDGADVALPDEVELPDGLFADGGDCCLEIEDYLSDLTGFCVGGYCIEWPEEVDLLRSVWETLGPRELARVFEGYMEDLGVLKAVYHGKTAYTVDGESYNWNKVECRYYPDGNACYGAEDFSIVMRKSMGDYLIFECGTPDGDISRLFEISNGSIVHLDLGRLHDKFQKHLGMFERLREAVMEWERAVG